MAKSLSKTGITTGNTVKAFHVTQSIDAFSGTDAYDIVLSGSLNINNAPVTNLTASGNISASGYIDGKIIEASTRVVTPSIRSATGGITIAPQNSNLTLTAATTASSDISSSHTGHFKFIRLPQAPGGTSDSAIYFGSSVTDDNGFIYDDGSVLKLGYNDSDVISIHDAVAGGISQFRVQGNSKFDSHITASGNISASGTSHVFGGTVKVIGNTTITGSLIVSGSSPTTVTFGNSLFWSNPSASLTFSGSMGVSGSITSNGSNVVTSNQTGSFLTGATGSFATTGSNNFSGNQTVTGSMTVTGSLTISGSNTLTNIGPFSQTGNSTFTGNITSSGTIVSYDNFLLKDGSDTGDKLVDILASSDDGLIRIYQNGSVNARIHGNGTSYFDGGNVGIGTGATVGEALTVTGNISASGTITGVTGSFSHLQGNSPINVGSGVIFQQAITASGDMFVSQYITHTGDTDTKINFLDDEIRFEAGNLLLFDIHKKGSAPHEVTVNTGGNNVDFIIKDDGNNTYFIADASTNRVGIGTSTPEEALTVTGNISASGTFIGDGSTLTNLQRPISGSVISNITASSLNAGFYFRCGGNVTCSIQTSSLVTCAVGSEFEFIQTSSAGYMSFLTGSGTILNSKDGKIKLAGQFSAATLKKVGPDEYDLIGDLG